jgi:hypothetical protein
MALLPMPPVNLCFPISDKYDSPCAGKPLHYAYSEQFATLMMLTHYRMLGGDVKPLHEYIENHFTPAEKPEMWERISIATDSDRIINFLAAKFETLGKDTILYSVGKSFEALKAQISEDQLKTYDALHLTEVGDPSFRVKCFKVEVDPCLGL